LIKTYSGTHLLLAIPAKEREARALYAGFLLSSLCKNSENPEPRGKLPTGMAHSAIPAQAEIQ